MAVPTIGDTSRLKEPASAAELPDMVDASATGPGFVPRPRRVLEQDDRTGIRAVVAHDYLTQRGGAERVALSLTKIFPGSPLVTSVYAPETTFPEFAGVDVRTGPLQRVPLVRDDPRLALPLLASAWEHTALPAADVVIASTSGWAHGVRTSADCALVAYCHNPARWLYQTEDYLPNKWVRAGFRPLRGALRRWDSAAAARVTTYLANSTNVARRIERVYDREATVVHPPMSLDVNGPQEAVPGLEPGFWLTVGRARGYKNTRAVIDGIRNTGSPLAVVGSPPPDEERRSSVKWLGVVSDAQLRWLYANARALVAVSREDFGLTPIEANAFGTPVAVLRAGGYLDSTVEGVSGIFIEEPTSVAVAHGLRDFPEFDRAALLNHADKFSLSTFGRRMKQIVAAAVAGQSLPAPVTPGGISAPVAEWPSPVPVTET